MIAKSQISINLLLLNKKSTQGCYILIITSDTEIAKAVRNLVKFLISLIRTASALKAAMNYGIGSLDQVQYYS